MKERYIVKVTNIETEAEVETFNTGLIYDGYIKACNVKEVYMKKYDKDLYKIEIKKV